MPRLNLSDAITEALLHDDHVVLGRRLEPFCLDHWMILSALKSPLLSGRPVSALDVRLAVQACSTTSYREFLQSTRSPNLGWRIWRAFHAHVNVPSALRQFNDYIDDYFPQFPRWRSDEGSGTKCPPLIVCCSRLIAAGHKTSEVRRMPLGEVIAWLTTHNEAQGIDDPALMSDVESEAVAAFEAEEAQAPVAVS